MVSVKGNNNHNVLNGKSVRLPIITKNCQSVDIPMAYDIKWIIPALRKPSNLWRLASTLTVVAVGLFSKLLIKWLNKPKIHNRQVIASLLDKRPKSLPLVTISNHHSCFDDPGLWGTLKFKHLISHSTMRWSLAAHDICFTCPQHSYFFSLGKCVPVVRGAGVYQDAVDFMIERLGKGDWVHIFPEGKVNMTKENIRFKWGVGRMIFEAPVTPLVVPIWHIGMDDVLPNEPPYVLRLGKRLTFNYGDPIDLSDMVRGLKEAKASDEHARKRITDYLQDKMLALKAQTEVLHAETL
ncbi:tafazzin isoform X2 [Cylas formicarius]|uniref:tafazzin isoform X2 n=1 Tax=Cylas formicarius TaxID=197179 RepID=UPI0029585C24|nr:tafazzin isoform X2 [Cylas formicarius]